MFQVSNKLLTSLVKTNIFKKMYFYCVMKLVKKLRLEEILIKKNVLLYVL